MAKGNQNSKRCSSSTAAHFKVTLKHKKTRSDLRRSTVLRVGAYDLYQSLMSNHFKVVEEIESLSKKNKKLSLKLKKNVIAFKQQQLRNPFSEHEESEVDTPSLLKRMMNQAISETSKNKKKATVTTKACFLISHSAFATSVDDTLTKSYMIICWVFSLPPLTFKKPGEI
jgi:hypothetical protein